MSNPFTSGRISALTETIKVATREQLITVTREKTADNLKALGVAFAGATPYERFVDGVLGKPLEQVSDHGFTLTRFNLLGGVVDEAFKALMQASPYGPAQGGHYRDDHWLYVNGVRRDFAQSGKVVEIGPADTVTIINVRPYSRKIEAGTRVRSGGRTTDRRPGLTVQAPNGVYEITARALQRRFGNIASITFTYRALMGAASAAGRSRKDRYPVIEISALT